MKKMLVVATLAVSATFAAPAAANASGSGLAGVQVGRCIVRADRQAAIALLQTLPLTGGAADWSSLSLGAAANCRKPTSPVTVSALRGGLAQELFRRDFGAIGVEPERGTAALARFDLPVEKNTMGADDRVRTLFVTADCVARSNTDATELLIKTEPGSDQELKAFDALGPWLSLCQKSGKMAYGRTELRSAIIQAAYRAAQRYATGEITQAGAR